MDRNKLQNFILPELLDQTEEGGELEAFERKNIPNGIFGIIIVLDLGSRIGLNKIRFYPRNTVQPSPTTPFEDDYLRAFDLLVNDGLLLTDEGNPVWRELVSESDNPGPVVEIDIDPPQVLRHIRLQSKTSINWEIDEIEIYGEGFFTTGRYLSDIFDAGEPVAWTNLRWSEEIVGRPEDSSLEIRTRTGTDDSPFVFTRKLNGISDAEEIPFAINSTTLEMDLEGYENLPPTDDEGRQWERGNILDDLVKLEPVQLSLPGIRGQWPGNSGDLPQSATVFPVRGNLSQFRSQRLPDPENPEHRLRHSASGRFRKRRDIPPGGGCLTDHRLHLLRPGGHQVIRSDRIRHHRDIHPCPRGRHRRHRTAQRRRRAPGRPAIHQPGRYCQRRRVRDPRGRGRRLFPAIPADPRKPQPGWWCGSSHRF